MKIIKIVALILAIVPWARLDSSAAIFQNAYTTTDTAGADAHVSGLTTNLVSTNDTRALNLSNPANLFYGSLIGNATIATIATIALANPNGQDLNLMTTTGAVFSIINTFSTTGTVAVANSVNPTNWNAQALASGVVTTNNFTNAFSLPGLNVVSVLLKTYNIADYGAVPANIANNCYMTAGSPTLIVKPGYNNQLYWPGFKAGDVGKSIMVYYAGVAKTVSYGVVPTTNYLALVGTILAVNNSTNITLSTNALHSIGDTSNAGVDQWNAPFTGMPAIYGWDSSAAINACYAYASTNNWTYISGGANIFHPEGVYILTNAPTLQNNCYSQLHFPDLIPLASEQAPVIHLFGPIPASTQLPRIAGYIGSVGATIVSFYNPTSPANNPSFSSGIYTNVYSVLSCQPSLGNGFFGTGKGSVIQANGFMMWMENMTWFTPPDRQYTCLDLRGAENVRIDHVLVGDGFNQANYGPTNGIFIWPTCTNSWGMMLEAGNNSGDSFLDKTTIFGYYNDFYPGEHLNIGNLLITGGYNGITPDYNGHIGTWATVEVDDVINAIYSLPGSSYNGIGIVNLQMENLASANNPNTANLAVAVNDTNSAMIGFIDHIITDSPYTNYLVMPTKIAGMTRSPQSGAYPSTPAIPMYENGLAVGRHTSGYAGNAISGNNDGVDGWYVYPDNANHFLQFNHLLNNIITSLLTIDGSNNRLLVNDPSGNNSILSGTLLAGGSSFILRIDAPGTIGGHINTDVNGNIGIGVPGTLGGSYNLYLRGAAIITNDITTVTGQFNGSGAGLINVPSSSVLTVTNNNLKACTTQTNIFVYTVPSSVTNTYQVGGYINVTAVSVDVIQAKVIFTDENNTSQTLSLMTSGISAVAFTPMVTSQIRCKGGTTITLQATLTTSAGSITYDTGGNIDLKQ